MKRVFLSVANSEHTALRASLREVLTRAGFDLVVQPDFPNSAADTVRTLDGLIAPCDLVLHFVGKDAGSRADAAVADFFAHTDRSAFLAHLPKAKRRLGDGSALTYFQWEAWLALNRRIDVLVYGVPGHEAPDFPQRAHLDALHDARRHADTLWSEDLRCAQIVADVWRHFGVLAPGTRLRLAPPRFLYHAAEQFLGREDEMAMLDTDWADGTNVRTLVAWGGVGKTALLVEWLKTRFIERHWLDFAGKPAVLAYFDWSFYQQGARCLTDEKAVRTGSVGDFFERALTHFGDSDPTLPDKGRRLVELVRPQRTLLVLDGVEPLQQPPGHPQAGRLLDPDLRDLLCGLAEESPGLCIVSSRQPLADLHGLTGKAVKKQDLDELPPPLAAQLLRHLGVRGTDRELAEACDKFGCHALSLTLVGRFLCDAHGGDIARLDRVRNLHRADELTREERHRTAWKVLEAYEAWLARARPDGQGDTLAVLRLIGLFDRTATPDCLAALRAPPAIPGLTEAIVAMQPDAWNILLRRLERARLIRLRADDGAPDKLGIDAHPLVREFFGQQLRSQQPDAFRAGHSRLFDHLCASTPHRPDGLAGLQPLYQAVVHGCLAERQQEACDKVYSDRILRGTGEDGYYSSKKLGAAGADLGAVAAFFEDPWSRLSPNLGTADQSWLLHEASTRLRALGRLTEALEPMRVSLEHCVRAGALKQAATAACNLSQLELTLGLVDAAVAASRRSIDFADRSKDAFLRTINRTAAGDALHHAGQREEARKLFGEAERLQEQLQPKIPRLYSLRGFQYADLLLGIAGRAAWQQVAACSRPSLADAIAACDAVHVRATETLAWVKAAGWLLDIALDHLTLARTGLYRTILAPDSASSTATAAGSLGNLVTTALAKLREANALTFLPNGLLTAAFHAATLGRETEQARRYLDEAQQIAERGPMPLHLADVHLHRARLFQDRRALNSARELIQKHGYGRRRDELADAEAAATKWPA